MDPAPASAAFEEVFVSAVPVRATQDGLGLQQEVLLFGRELAISSKAVPEV